jgi:hypothetical protein
MSQRRALLEGLDETLNVDPALAEEFVYGKKAKAKPPTEDTETPAELPPVAVKEGKGPAPTGNASKLTRIIARRLIGSRRGA